MTLMPLILHNEFELLKNRLNLIKFILEGLHESCGLTVYILRSICKLFTKN